MGTRGWSRIGYRNSICWISFSKFAVLGTGVGGGAVFKEACGGTAWEVLAETDRMEREVEGCGTTGEDWTALEQEACRLVLTEDRNTAGDERTPLATGAGAGIWPYTKSF